MEGAGRGRKSIINIGMALVSQAATVLIGMLLPRALMRNYGSETNGLITSMQQLISYLTLIEGGLLSAAAVSLYKPLAENRIETVNAILAAAKYFYRKTGAVFVAVLTAAALVYPFLIADTGFAPWQVSVMALLIGVNGATQILFIGKYKALLMAAQYNGVILAINAGSTVLYSGVLIAAAYIRVDVVIGLAIAVVAYLIRALAFYAATRVLLPQYRFDADRGQIAFPQRTDALISQLLTMLSLHGGVVILSFFRAPMELISVYTTYNLVLSGLYMLMYSVENSVTSALGDLLAREAIGHVRKSYERFDALYHMLWTVIVSCLFVLLLPFIRVYTSGVQDAQYILPFEGFLFVCIGGAWMLRNQLTLLMTARGSFRDMRNSMIIEALIVLAGGGTMFCLWGLKGMLLAKLMSIVYMICRLARYTYGNILGMRLRGKVQRMLLSLCAVAAASLICSFLFGNMQYESLGMWLFQAVITAVISSAISACVFISYMKNKTDNF